MIPPVSFKLASFCSFEKGHPWNTVSGRHTLLKGFPQRQRLACSPDTRDSTTSEASCKAVVLDRYWVARGVVNQAHREELVNHGVLVPKQGSHLWSDDSADLPGPGMFWRLQWDSTASDEIYYLSKRIWELHVLLGNRMDLDAGSILAKCPRLLTADLDDLTERLISMMGTPGADSLDIGKMIEGQPALLLAQDSGQESVDAWMHGLTSSSDQNWHSHLSSMKRYRQQHGDVHIGFRQDDEEDLVKLARMLRHDHRKKVLSQESVQELEELGFEFDEGNAEWQVMYKQLQALIKAETSNPDLMAGNADFLLNNWCSVQRISKRAGVLSPTKVEMLDAIEFDWSGADALS